MFPFKSAETSPFVSDKLLFMKQQYMLSNYIDHSTIVLNLDLK